MYISYDHYRIFYYVAKYGSFTRAATALYSNQPNLTRAIKSLESSLGCTLFERSNKGVRLTEDGEKLYESVSLAVESIASCEERLRASKTLESGSISIGATEIALRCSLLPTLKAYRSSFPGIRIKIVNVSTPQALGMVENGLVDIAVVTTPVELSESIVQTKLADLRELAVCSSSFSSLCKKDRVTLDELCKYPMISLGEKSSTYKFYLKLFSSHGLSFSPDVEAATADQLLPLIRHDLGVGFVPEAFLDGGTENDGIFRIPLEPPVPQRSIVLLKKKKHALSLPARMLEQMITRDCV